MPKNMQIHIIVRCLDGHASAQVQGEVVHSGHRIGQDTRAILRDLLALDDARIDALAQAQIIRCDTAMQPVDEREPSECDQPGVG